jgi:hypothetical protein
MALSIPCSMLEILAELAGGLPGTMPCCPTLRTVREGWGTLLLLGTERVSHPPTRHVSDS